MSKDKYHSRQEELLNILFYSKELPSDLYIQMNMSYDNYRKYISFLLQNNIIKKINKDRTIGYILTTSGKKLTNQFEYSKYKDCVNEEKRKYDLVHRHRKRQFAYLYALFDRAGIPYERFNKPNLNEAAVNGDKVYFYTALDFKKMIGIEATVFTGSRVLGFFIGKGQIIPVYRTNQLLKAFNSYEVIVPEIISQHFDVTVNAAVLICNNTEAVADISNQIIYNNESELNYGVNTAKYKTFYIFPSNDSFISHFNDLYIDQEEEERKVIEQYGVDISDRDSKGRLRVNVGAGYIENSPILIFTGNINVVKARSFIREAEYNDTTNYIICKRRDHDCIAKLIKEQPIKIIGI